MLLRQIYVAGKNKTYEGLYVKCPVLYSHKICRLLIAFFRRKIWLKNRDKSEVFAQFEENVQNAVYLRLYNSYTSNNTALEPRSFCLHIIITLR